MKPAFTRVWAKPDRTRGDMPAAEQALRRAAELSPGSAEMLNPLANLLLDTDRAAEALPLLRRAVAARPDYVRGTTTWARRCLG